MKRALLVLLVGSVLTLPLPAASERIVSLGGAVTETVCALGAQAGLVGVDSSSTAPPAVAKLPQVGYQRKVSAEGVLSLKPTLVLASDEAGPPEALEQLRQAGVKVIVLPAGNSVDGAVKKVQAIAEALGAADNAKPLVQAMTVQADRATKAATAGARAPRVLFLYARSGAGILAAGTGTEAEAMIQLAGGKNVITEYKGYRPLTAEAAVAAAPEVILSITDGVASLGGEKSIYDAPGISLTPARKKSPGGPDGFALPARLRAAHGGSRPGADQSALCRPPFRPLRRWIVPCPPRPCAILVIRATGCGSGIVGKKFPFG
ncbi:MAG: helical backbone metal receptor [Chthoniobacteraceae bacterium]